MISVNDVRIHSRQMLFRFGAVISPIIDTHIQYHLNCILSYGTHPIMSILYDLIRKKHAEHVDFQL